MIYPKSTGTFIVTALAVLYPNISPSHAFQVTSVRQTNRDKHVIFSSTIQSKDRIAKAGGGIPIVPNGDCRLFNPEEEGKLQGTGALFDRIEKGYEYSIDNTLEALQKQQQQDNMNEVTNIDPSTVITSAPPMDAELKSAQHWLEDLDANGVPQNFAKASSPVEATLLHRERIIGADAPGDIQHLLIRLPEGMNYVEGQSLSVIPPGVNEKTGKKHSPRLYSIASTRYGDVLDGRTVSLCVRRALYYDPVTGVEDVSKKGVCSNFLCDAKPFSTLKVAGPVGKTMLMPKDLEKDVIMVATGTGIAPFRSFLRRLFVEDTVSRHMFGGMAWLVLGVPTTSGILYKNELDEMMKNARPSQLKIDYAISREMRNSIDGGKLYVQHVIAQKAAEFFSRLDNGAVVYFCGLKGMMPPILETLKKVAEEEHGLNWDEKLSVWKKNGQWHVEVY